MPTVVFSTPDALRTALEYLRYEIGLTNVEVQDDSRLRILGLRQEALWHALDRVDHTRGQCNVFKCMGRALRPPERK